MNSPQILLVAIESCVWDTLLIYLFGLLHLGRLACLVVNEAHLLPKHKSFRPCINFLKVFGSILISIVLLTTTCPPALEKTIFQKLGHDIYCVLRQGTDRPEIAQHMIPIALKGSDNLESIVVKEISTLMAQLVGDNRMLLFCLSHEDCGQMGMLLDWKPYNSAISLENRSKFMNMWWDGLIPGLVCTSMLNCCLDYPAVRFVFHLDAPRDAVDYYQAIGRCARDGKPGTSFVYYVPRNGTGPSGEDPFGRSVIWEMLHGSGTSLCQRVLPGKFLDAFSIPCTMQQNANLCDICLKGITADRHVPTNLTKSPSFPTQSALSLCLPSKTSPFNNPAPHASFGILVVAAIASMQSMPPSPEEKLGLKVRQACDALANCCV